MSTANLIDKVLISNNTVTAIPVALIEQYGSDPETWVPLFDRVRPSTTSGYTNIYSKYWFEDAKDGECKHCGCKLKRKDLRRYCCSNVCKDAWRKARRNATRVTRAKAATERSCNQCGEVFTAIRFDAVYCSSGCRVKSHRETK